MAHVPGIGRIQSCSSEFLASLPRPFPDFVGAGKEPEHLYEEEPQWMSTRMYSEFFSGCSVLDLSLFFVLRQTRLGTARPFWPVRLNSIQLCLLTSTPDIHQSLTTLSLSGLVQLIVMSPGLFCCIL